jgi:hypothetical protein
MLGLVDVGEVWVVLRGVKRKARKNHKGKLNQTLGVCSSWRKCLQGGGGMLSEWQTETTQDKIRQVRSPVQTLIIDVLQKALNRIVRGIWVVGERLLKQV